jgi:acyl carrier protein
MADGPGSASGYTRRHPERRVAHGKNGNSPTRALNLRKCKVLDSPDSADLTEQVREVLALTLGLDESEVGDDISQRTYSRWSSLYQITLLVALEERFGVTFSMDETLAMTSLANIVTVLRQRLLKPVV